MRSTLATASTDHFWSAPAERRSLDRSRERQQTSAAKFFFSVHGLSSNQEHLVDALAHTGDEGRGTLR